MPISLSDRQKLYLELLKRQRVSTSEINIKVSEGSESIAKKLILSLKDLVASDPLGPKSVYYRLTLLGAKLIGAPEEIAKPLGPQALPKALGILGFCISGSPTRERYLRHEFQNDFPELAKELLAKDYHTDFFLDHDGEQARLGQIVVDQGGDYRKLISKCRVKLREYLEVPGLRDIVADGLLHHRLCSCRRGEGASNQACLEGKASPGPHAGRNKFRAKKVSVSGGE